MSKNEWQLLAICKKLIDVRQTSHQSKTLNDDFEQDLVATEDLYFGSEIHQHSSIGAFKTGALRIVAKFS